VFLFLIVPFGAMGGYLSVAIGYQLTQAGVSVEEVAALVAFSYLPQTWKFLWAPIADTTLSRKTWYLLAGAVSALGIFATGAVPADERSLPLLYAAVLVSNVAVTFLAMATESLTRTPWRWQRESSTESYPRWAASSAGTAAIGWTARRRTRCTVC
jgi:hypothetical protein